MLITEHFYYLSTVTMLPEWSFTVWLALPSVCLTWSISLFRRDTASKLLRSVTEYMMRNPSPHLIELSREDTAGPTHSWTQTDSHIWIVLHLLHVSECVRCSEDRDDAHLDFHRCDCEGNSGGQRMWTKVITKWPKPPASQMEFPILVFQSPHTADFVII